jgi:hypothetical protein
MTSWSFKVRKKSMVAKRLPKNGDLIYLNGGSEIATPKSALDRKPYSQPKAMEGRQAPLRAH